MTADRRHARNLSFDRWPTSDTDRTRCKPVIRQTPPIFCSSNASVSFQIATNCRMFFSFISLPGPRAITSPRSITRYWSASSSAKS
jgi:hypothetical protein